MNKINNILFFLLIILSSIPLTTSASAVGGNDDNELTAEQEDRLFNVYTPITAELAETVFSEFNETTDKNEKNNEENGRKRQRKYERIHLYERVLEAFQEKKNLEKNEQYPIATFYASCYRNLEEKLFPQNDIPKSLLLTAIIAKTFINHDLREKLTQGLSHNKNINEIIASFEEKI